MPFRRKPFLAIGLPVLLALIPMGCARFTPGRLDAGNSAAAFSERSLSDSGLKQFLSTQRAGNGPWNLERLSLAASYFNGEVAVARAEAGQASAGIDTAGERPNPVFSFSPGYNATTTGISPWIISPSLDVTIETAGKRRERSAVARATAESARLRVADAAWTVRAKVRTAMLELYGAGESITLLKTEARLHEEAVAKLDAQVKAGALAGFELIQERLSANRSKLALHDAEKLAATSRAELAAAVGVAAAALDAARLDFADFSRLPPAPAAGLRRRALTHRADLLALLADYAAAEGELRLQIAKQYPDIHLSPGYELDQTDTKWHLGLSFEIPILNRNKGPIAEAEAKRKTAAAKFEAKQQAVFGDIETALAGYQAARSKITTAETLARESKHAGDVTEKMVAAGEVSPIELLRRRLEASAADLSLLESRLQAQQAAGLLEAAVQTPLLLFLFLL